MELEKRCRCVKRGARPVVCESLLLRRKGKGKRLDNYSNPQPADLVSKVPSLQRIKKLGAHFIPLYCFGGLEESEALTLESLQIRYLASQFKLYTDETSTFCNRSRGTLRHASDLKSWSDSDCAAAGKLLLEEALRIAAAPDNL